MSMVFDWATSGPYEGATVTLVETYRGWDIYFLTGPGGLYGIVDPNGVEKSPFHSTLAGARLLIDGWIAALPPEEPDPFATEYHSTYRDIEIRQFLVSRWFTFETPLMVYALETIEACHTRIDADLFVGPPEPEPPTGTKTLIAPYRGIDIYKWDETGQFWFTHEGEEYTITLWNDTITTIDSLLGALPVPDEYAASYGGYIIYLVVATQRYYVMVDNVPTGDFMSIIEAQMYIETVLGWDPGAPPYTPGEDPDYTPMDDDPIRAAAISGPVQDFLNAVGLTPEALEAVRGSGADPEKAANYAKSVSLASVGAIAILGTIGVVAEVASLGQVEGVLGTIDMVLEKTGIAGLLDELFKIPFMEAVVKPAHHYWASQYTPEIPGSGDLITFLVREIITPAEFNKNMALQGYSQYWADNYWESHWRLPSIGDIIRAEHLGIITKEERDVYFILHDYRSDNRPGISVSDLQIYGGLTKQLLGRVDTRRAYQYGYMDRLKLIEMYKAQGYEEDAELQTDIQIRASVDGLQSAIRREQGMIFRDRIKDAREDESAAVSAVLSERDEELAVILLRWRGDEIPEIDLLLFPTAWRDRALAEGPLTEEEAVVMEADMRAKADTAIYTVRAVATTRVEEAEGLYRVALAAVGDLIDPTDLWVMRYKLAAERVEVAGEFEIEAPVLVEETAEEPA